MNYKYFIKTRIEGVLHYVKKYSINKSGYVSVTELTIHIKDAYCFCSLRKVQEIYNKMGIG